MRAKTGLIALLLLSLLPSCIVIPTKLPTKVRGPAGVDLAKDAIRVDHIRVGVSTRDDVKRELAAVDTNVDLPRLFWGRWVSSSFGVIAGMMWGFGPGEQADGSSRHWHTYDLFVTFDDHGVVTAKKVIQDNNVEVWSHLRAVNKELALPLPTATIASEPGEDEQSQAFFAPAEVKFAGTKKHAGATMKLSPQLQVEITSDFQSKTVQNAGLQCYVGKFRDHASGASRKNHFCLQSAQLLQVVQLFDGSETQLVVKK
jgi:hypothetical protein